MFRSRSQDQLHKLADAPQSSVGAPLPLVLADERQVLVVYRTEEHDPDWDGTSVRSVNPDSAGRIAIALFEGVWASQFGAPNDEALHGHPLFERGLRSYGAFTVKPSSWRAELEKRNAVHTQHRPEHFEMLTHYVLTFHDSTFECVARSVDFELTTGSVTSVANRVAAQLGR